MRLRALTNCELALDERQAQLGDLVALHEHGARLEACVASSAARCLACAVTAFCASATCVVAAAFSREIARRSSTRSIRSAKPCASRITVAMSGGGAS